MISNRLSGWQSRFSRKFCVVLAIAVVWVVTCLVSLGRQTHPILLAEIEQKLSWDVAAELNGLLERARYRAGTDAAISQQLELFKLLYPKSQVYVIDSAGAVLRELGSAAAPERLRIELAPVRRALEDLSPRLPLYADDPSTASGSALFSVSRTRIGDECRSSECFLYVTLKRFAERRPMVSMVSDAVPAWIPMLIIQVLAGVLGWALWTQSLNSRLGALVASVDRFGRVRKESGGRSESRRSATDELDGLQRDIDELSERLIRERAVVEERAKRRKRMILNIVHDLRIPLTSVRGFLELALAPHSTRDNSERLGFLQRARQSIGHQRDLFGDLFLLSELEEGRSVEQSEQYSIEELARATVETLQPAAEAKGIQLSLDAPLGLPNLTGDTVLMKRALGNLINNAIKFTAAEGAVAVRLASGAGGDGAERVQIEVADNGIGIPEGELPFLFDDFYRVQQDESPTIEGAGLGLAIVREIIRKHGGEISVRSREGEGSTFKLELPVTADRRESAVALIPKRSLMRELLYRVPYLLSALCAFWSLLLPVQSAFLPRTALLALSIAFLRFYCRSAQRAPVSHDSRSAFLRAARPQGMVELLQLFVGATTVSLLVEQLIFRSFGLFSSFVGLVVVFALLTVLPSLSFRSVLVGFVPAVYGAIRGGMAIPISGLFYLGSAFGLAGGLIGLTALIPWRYRPLAVKWFVGFLLLFCFGGLVTAIVGLKDTDQSWRRVHREQLHDIAERLALAKGLGEGATPGMNDTQIRERIRRRLYPALVLAPMFDFFLLDSDCGRLVNLGPHLKQLLAYDNARRAVVANGNAKECFPAMEQSLSELTDFSRTTIDTGGAYSPELFVGLEGSLFNIVSKKSAQHHLPRLLLSGLLVEIAAAALIAIFLHVRVGRPLSRRWAQLRLLKSWTGRENEAESLQDFEQTPAEEDFSPFGTDALFQISAATNERIAASREEDDARRAFLRSISKAFRPSLECVETGCERLVCESGTNDLDLIAVRDLFEEVLYQSELLRTTFEVTKLEGASIRPAADCIEIGELLEDAELGAASLFSNRAVTIQRERAHETNQFTGDAPLVELMIDSVLKQLYFAAAARSEISISVSEDGRGSVLCLRATLRGQGAFTAAGAPSVSFSLADAILNIHDFDPVRSSVDEGVITVWVPLHPRHPQQEPAELKD